MSFSASSSSGPGFQDLEFARLDTDRAARTGDAEVIFGQGKTTDQIRQLVAALRQAHPDRPALVTRCSDEAMAMLETTFDESWIDPIAHCVSVGPLPVVRGKIGVLSAGTADGPVAAEAAFVARVCGTEPVRITDVGVAGIHRLLAARDIIEQMDCLIVVAGMDGALPSAVGGLTGVPIVAVPTSVGYGASFDGLAPLLTMLNSCAPGVVVCNIDNGFGAGIFAARVARRAAR